METGDELERLMGKLGEFGRYQCYQFILHVLAAIPTGIGFICLVTIAAVPGHRCSINGVDTFNYSETWNSTFVTKNIPTNENGHLDSCHIYGINGTIEECDSWVYDTTYHKSSRGMEWNFVCRRKWMGAIAQASFMFGVVLAGFIVGPLCDNLGRRTVFVWTAILQLASGIFVAFVNDYYLFIVLRFLYGTFTVSPFKVGYITMTELVGPTKRAFCGAVFQVLFGIGIMLLGVWGYLIESRFYLQIAYASHAAMLLPHWFLMDESPRWLWARGRIREATVIIEKALKVNKSKETVDNALVASYHKIPCDSANIRTTTFLDLFKTRNMAKKSLIIIGCWFAASVLYYGFALNTGKLYGNPFLMLFLSGFFELPGYIMGMCFVNRIGNRAVMSSTLILGGITCLILAGLSQASTVTTVFAMIGKLISAASFAIVYKYTAELFPTVVRSTGVCIGSLLAAVTPLLNLLETLKPEYPTILFGLSGILFGFCCMFLPETQGKKLPQTMEDGENFGKGDTCFSNCWGRKISHDSECPEVLQPLK